MRIFFLFVTLYFVSFSSAYARQEISYPDIQINAQHISSAIQVDGVLDEAIWEEAGFTSQFYNKWPADTGYAVNQSKAWIVYDDEYLYVAAINYQSKKNILVKSLKRDKPEYHWDSEAFSVVLDPFNQQVSGFLFGVNAAGAQLDGQIGMKNSRTRPDFNWDNVWFSAVKTHEDHWIAEFAIPFKSLNYNSEQQEWGINFVRNDMKRNEYSTWNRVPLGFPGIDMGHLGTLKLEKQPPANSKRTVIQPYVLGSGTNNYATEETADYEIKIGGNAKIPVGSSLKADLTINPDFSTVDVDQQITNLTRFSISLPEKRTFFLENSDLFSDFGTWGIRPFFSRKIGLNNGNAVPILFGARVTGNLTPTLRTGIMNVHTRASGDLAANNYTIASFQQKLVGRTNIKALLTNRSAFDEFNAQSDNYNRTLGAELNYTSPSGEFTGNLRYHWAQTEEKLSDASFAGATMIYNNGTLVLGFTGDRLGTNYISDVGFSPRLFHHDASRDSLKRVGYYFANPWFSYSIRPESDWINNHRFNVWTNAAWETDGNNIERISQFRYSLNTFNKGSFEIALRQSKIRLLFPTDLIGGNSFLPAKSYNFARVELSYDSDRRGVVNWEVNGSYGGFYNGSRIEVGGNINIRQQPWGNFGINYIGNKVDLPGEYGNAILHLVGPQAEISFSNNLNWTTFLQFNTQNDRFNLNSRIQWRFAAMSDLYIVFNDNYDTNRFSPQNRGVVFKLNYWFN
ncbi:MAG: carbohydrate binding family 9 domain-containing protein [Balneolaceae bacterium]|nr:carbohydrate binding family 9 domain-containing protein [Balneolaceae bacterium]